MLRKAGEIFSSLTNQNAGSRYLEYVEHAGSFLLLLLHVIPEKRTRNRKSPNLDRPDPGENIVYVSIAAVGSCGVVPVGDIHLSSKKRNILINDLATFQAIFFKLLDVYGGTKTTFEYNFCGAHVGNFFTFEQLQNQLGISCIHLKNSNNNRDFFLDFFFRFFPSNYYLCKCP